MDDLISRQAAIDAIGKASDELYENIKKGATFPQRQWFDGMAYAQSILENLPSAQQEIIRCKDCKYSYAMITAKSKDGQERWIRFCDKHKNWYPKDDWFCADGERKEE